MMKLLGGREYYGLGSGNIIESGTDSYIMGGSPVRLTSE